MPWSGRRSHRDPIARRTAPHAAGPLRLTLDANLHTARTVRAGLRTWLPGIGADPDQTSDVVHAISEFVENAVEHGDGAATFDETREIVVEAALAGDGNLYGSVADRGR